LFHADGQTDRYDESNSRFSQFFESAENCLKRIRNLGDADGLSDSDSSVCFVTFFGIRFFWPRPGREGIFIYRVRLVDVLLIVALVRGKFFLEVY